MSTHKDKLATRHPDCQVGAACGFTLIELLVVVAIIALLVAILVPTLTEANRIAKMVVCKTHLKQIALGINLYCSADPLNVYPTFSALGGHIRVVQDDPSMPGYYFRVSILGEEPSGNFKTWMDLVFPYVDKTLGVFVCTGFEDPRDVDPDVFESWRNNDGSDPDLPYPPSTHYGYNAHIGHYSNQALRPGTLGALRVGEIKRPSEIALVLDYRSIYSYNVWWDYDRYAAGYGLGEPWDYFRAHGGEQTNMAFVDNHVEAIDRLDPEYIDYYHWDPLQD